MGSQLGSGLEEKGWKGQVPRPLLRASPLARRKPSCCWIPKRRCRAWRPKSEGSARRCAQMSPGMVAHFLTPSPHLPRTFPVLLPPPTWFLPVPIPLAGGWPVLTPHPSGSGPGADGTGQAGGAVPRGGRGAAGAGGPPAPPAGGTATLPRAPPGGRGLQGPARGEAGGRAAGLGIGWAWPLRDRVGVAAGDRLGQERREFGRESGLRGGPRCC